MDKDDILLRIKKLMNHFNLNSSQFADKIGMDRSNFSKLFTTDKIIGNGILTKIAYCLNINKDWILTGEEPMIKAESETVTGYCEKCNEKQNEIDGLRKYCEAIEKLNNEYELQLGKKDKAM